MGFVCFQTCLYILDMIWKVAVSYLGRCDLITSHELGVWGFSLQNNTFLS